jgi:hypothetical protein
MVVGIDALARDYKKGMGKGPPVKATAYCL